MIIPQLTMANLSFAEMLLFFVTGEFYMIWHDGERDDIKMHQLLPASFGKYFGSIFFQCEGKSTPFVEQAKTAAMIDTFPNYKELNRILIDEGSQFDSSCPYAELLASQLAQFLVTVSAW